MCRPAGYAMDADAADDPACASMQLVPHTLAPGANGYLDAYDGAHLWQVLWVR